MPTPVFLNPRTAAWLKSALKRQSDTSEPISLGTFDPKYSWLYQDFDTSDALDSRRVSWNRQVILPTFDRRSSRGLELVELPAARIFKWENENDLPRRLPHITIRPVRPGPDPGRSAGTPRPVLFAPHGRQEHTGKRTPLPNKYRVYVSNGNRKRPEARRRRFDEKTLFGYNRALTLVNRTYGRMSEARELYYAIAPNLHDPAAALAAVAAELAIDRAYGLRARKLKTHIYDKPWYNLPVGLQTARRFNPF